MPNRFIADYLLRLRCLVPEGEASNALLRIDSPSLRPTSRPAIYFAFLENGVLCSFHPESHGSACLPMACRCFSHQIVIRKAESETYLA